MFIRALYSSGQEGVLSHSSDWPLALECVGAWLPPRTCLGLLSTRPEMQDGAALTETQQQAVQELQPLLDALHEQ